ncbi:MAG: hypothetical protein R2873_20410 [Caldilineaceae bacterium]
MIVEGIRWAAFTALGWRRQCRRDGRSLQARDDERSVIYALAIAEGKLRNQVNLLKYEQIPQREKQPDVFDGGASAGRRGDGPHRRVGSIA